MPTSWIPASNIGETKLRAGMRKGSVPPSNKLQVDRQHSKEKVLVLVLVLRWIMS